MKDIYNLIPPDDLHWVEDRFTPFSDDEYKKIIDACHASNYHELNEIMKMVRWCEQIRCGSLFINGLMSGRLKFDFNENEEPSFSVKEML